MRGRIAIVTGASAGIGEAVVRELACQGVKIVANARRVEKIQTLADELKAKDAEVVSVPGDASREDVVEALFTAAEQFGGPPDIVVVNAGRGLPGTIGSSDISLWEEVIKTNIYGALLLMRKASSILVQSKTARPSSSQDIVVLGSCVGRHVIPAGAVYSATKFAVNSAAEALRRELGPKGVRVTLIEPGIVETEFHTVGKYGENFYEKVAGEKGPLITGADVARAISFVISQPAHVHIHDIGIRPVRQDYP